MARFVYSIDRSGTVTREEVSKPLRGTPAVATMGFHERMLNGYRQAELAGDRWTGPYSRNATKRLHEAGRDRE